MMSDSNTDNIRRFPDMEELPEPLFPKGLLNPTDRISEVLFGLIMALTFTCTISVINADKTEMKGMLIGAISCNIAWGIVDAVMYLVITMTEKGRGLTIINFVSKSKDNKKSYEQISQVLPPIVASVIETQELEVIRQRLLTIKDPVAKSKLDYRDFKTAIGILILVILSTFPVVIPFIFISDLKTALRTSNIIAILIMYLCGWNLAKYSGRNRFITGMIISLLGILMVALTIALGG